MGALYGGQETIPTQVDHPIDYTVEEVNLITQQGFGPSPAEAQQIIEQAEEARRLEAEYARLAQMEADALRANQEYYGKGGAGYVNPYMEKTAEIIYDTLDPYYGEGGMFEPVTVWVDPERTIKEEYGFGGKEVLIVAGLVAGALLLK